MAKSLTVLSARNAETGRHADGGGLYLRVAPTGSRHWLLRVQVNGKRRDIGLGSFTDLTLAEAREEAARLRKVARRGLDPIAERDRDKNALVIPSFAQAMAATHADKSKGWSEKHAALWLASLERHAVPHLGQRKVDAIDHSAVRDALAPIWTDKPQIARKVRVHIMQVLDYAQSRGWRTAAAPQARVIAQGLGRQAKGGNFAAMPYAQTPILMAALETAQPMTIGRWALMFTILTAARGGEVRQAAWDQFDLEGGMWHRPASIMKSREAHSVTLSAPAVAILEAVKPLNQGAASGAGLVFLGTGGRLLSDMTMTKALRAGLSADDKAYTVHGFRSAFRDWAAETMPTIPPMVAEMALAHAVGNKVERAYLRTELLDQRRVLLDGWGAYVTGGTGADADNVVRLAAVKGAGR